MNVSEKYYLSLSDDLLFKEAFAHPDNRDKLIYFLSVFTNLSKEYLESVNLHVEYESVLTKTKRNDASLRGDVIVRFDNYIINLEDYSTFDDNSFCKSTNYIMRISSTHLNRGKVNYKKLKNVIQINIVDNVLSNKFINNELKNEIVLYNKVYKKEIYTKLFQIKYYRVDTARNMIYDKDNLQQRWLRFIGAKSSKERKEIAKGDRLLMEFDKWCEDYINDEQTKKFYGEWAKEIAQEKAKREIALEKAHEIALKMLKANMPKRDISKFTGLSLKELRNL